MVKVLAIGGSGGMGRFAVREMLSCESIGSVVVADINAQSAASFASDFGGRASSLGLDVTDPVALRNALKGIDVVVNTSGPFFKFAVPILEACIEIKCHYFDICDDWEPTEEMLKLDQKAVEAGITAVIGLGASPGITNFLGLFAINELDTVESLYTGWHMGGAKPEAESSQTRVNAAMMHGVQQMTGSVKVFSKGQEEMVSPLRGLKLDYPGRGVFDVRIFGHPEAITFPHHYPAIKDSMNVCHGGESGLFVIRTILTLVNWGLLTMSRAAAWLHWLESRPRTEDSVREEISLPPIYALAEGVKNGRRGSVGVCFSAESENILADLGMGMATGIPLAIGVRMLAEGKINKKGVMAPEAGHIDPETFIPEVLRAFSGQRSQGLKRINEVLKVSVKF